jgi:hypothetical protein
MNNQALRGEQARARTRKRIALAVRQTMSTDPRTIAEVSGLSFGTIRKNTDHIALIFTQESNKQP